MNKTVDLWIDTHREEMINSLRTIVGFKSVNAPADGNAPFGTECRKALEYALELCRKFGFRDKNMENYIGYADCGRGEETLGILSHLDVVPEGDGWAHEPYGASTADGFMVGRGVMDDKGPAICSIYALAAVKEAGLDFRRTVRLIFGCDEEIGMRCLTHYFNSGEKVPELAFSPDAEYPLVNSEKNIYNCTYSKKFNSSITVKAGTVVNAVPGFAVATVPVDVETVRAAADPQLYEVEPWEGGARITARGIAAHASLPSLGRNAIQLMIRLLAKLPLKAEDKAVAEGLWNGFKMDYYGESVGLDLADDSGRLTLNVGLMDWNSDGCSVSVDVRAPISTSEDTVVAAMDAVFGKIGAREEHHVFKPGHYVPENGELVSELLKVYRERTGDMQPPKHIGGGTYARNFPNAVAFGPERDYRENRPHMTDESFNLDDLIEDTKIIADAIIALACK